MQNYHLHLPWDAQGVKGSQILKRYRVVFHTAYENIELGGMITCPLKDLLCFHLLPEPL